MPRADGNNRRVRRWRCARCGRTFARANQWHSCKTTSVVSHLAKATPPVQAAYRELISAVRRCGGVRVVPTLTGINLLATTSFGGITLRRNWLDLGLILTRRLDSDRVISVLQLSRNRWAHRIRVEPGTAVDAELKNWIREAHRIGRLAGRR